MDVLPKLVWHYNEPFADPSAVPTYYVSEIARQHITVALNGDGGDENFLGYGRYKLCLQSEWISRLPRPLRRVCTAIARVMPPGLERYRVLRVARRWLTYVSEQDSRRYAPFAAYFYEQDKLAGYGEALIPYLSESSLDLLEPYFAGSNSFVGGAARADIHTYLPDDLLVKVDIASMAHGLEARSPFLDHTLMEWAARIPPALKMSKGITKSILKQSMKRFLPDEVLYRPKMGFGVPIDHWFRHDMKEFAYDILLSESARQRGLVKESFVRTMLDEHCAGVRMHQTRLWALLMLELWFRMWIDSPTPLLSPPTSSMALR
jgi:asparagine synthase (glutamine-hydrolysing)